VTFLKESSIRLMISVEPSTYAIDQLSQSA
jgi:hypothetical protein